MPSQVVASLRKLANRRRRKQPSVPQSSRRPRVLEQLEHRCLLATLAYTSFEEPATGGQYVDTGNAAVDHDLVNNAGQASVDYTSIGGEMGFDAAYVNTRNDVGLTDGDFVGVTSFTGDVTAYPDGTQGYQLQDTDGLMRVAFDAVDLSGAVNVQVSLQYFVKSTTWETSPADSIVIQVQTDQGNFTILDTTGSDIDDLGIEGSWRSGSVAIPDNATTATLVVSLDSNAADESIYLDNVVFSGDVAGTFDLRITEAWVGQDGADLTEDWFEITNIGTATWTAATDGNLYYDDDSQDAGTADLVTGIPSIAPGESVVVLLDGAGDGSEATNFTAVWGPDIDLSGVQIGYTGPAGALGQSGDGVALWVGGPSGVPDVFAIVPAVASGVSYDLNLGAPSTVGNAAGAVQTMATAGSTGNEPAIGSPGRIQFAPMDTSSTKPPAFLGSIHTDGDNGPAEYYASGNDDPFSEFGIASFRFSKVDFGLPGNQAIDDITVAQFTLTHNDRTFSDGDLVEVFLTIQEFGGDYGPLAYNSALFNGIDVTQFSSPPVSLGQFPYTPEAGGSTDTFLLDFGASEADVIARLNAGAEFSLIIGVTNASHDITYSGLNNSFDPGDPVLDLTVTSVPTTDNGPPQIAALSPADDSFGVVLDSNLTITFDELVQAGSGNVTIRDASDNSLVESIDVTGTRATVSGASLTLDPASILANGSQYYVEIPGGAVLDIAGNPFAGIGDPTTWNFATVQSPITHTGPFSVSENALAGTLVGDVNPNITTPSGITYTLVGGSGTDSMMDGLQGNIVTPLLTVGDTLSGTTGALNSTTAGDYQPVGILDGIGAYPHPTDPDLVRIFVNHELSPAVGATYTLENGTALTGARISYFDIDKGSRSVVDGGLAYRTVYDRAGTVVTTPMQVNQGSSATNGFDRFCSAALIPANEFGAGRGIVDTIYFAGEESSTAFGHPHGGSEWALDVTSGELWAVPDMGRGSWENVAQLDTGTTTHVAFVLGDDLEAAPLYLYIGQKNPAGSFLERNGLVGGQLYVWGSNGTETDPSDFNGTGSTLNGTWLPINARDPGMAGQPGHDAQGYKDDSTLRAEAAGLGGFVFSRPEDVSVDPSDGTRFVLASTGRGNLFGGADNWGTTYIVDLDFANLGTMNPLTASIQILYDGDDAGGGQFPTPQDGLRSPDNLDWADDGSIYIQEDRANTSGSFGGPNNQEASIWRLNPTSAAATRVAQIDRGAVLPLGTTDSSPNDTGNWESSGILDVSSLFGEAPGTLILFDTQAHSLTNGLIGANGLVQGGQLAFLQIGGEGDAFRINPNTGAITVANADAVDLSEQAEHILRVQAFDGVNHTFETIQINVTADPIAPASSLRVATFNAFMNRGSAGALLNNLSTPNDPQVRSVAEIIQITSPDVILINEFDYDAAGEALRLFQQNYLEVSQNGESPVHYGYTFNAPSNTGTASGLDLDNNGVIDTTPGDDSYAGDAFGFGPFEGNFGMVFLSKYPILEDQVRTFQQFLWRDMPGALLPPDPNDADGNSDTSSWFTAAELDVVRLSSKSHWDIPVLVNGQVIHALASHPTPPVFDDGTETDFMNPTIVDQNGRRNHDEIRFWADYINGASYIYDDAEYQAAGQTTPGSPSGGLSPGARFVILGDQNADPNDGDSTGNPANLLLGDPLVNTSLTPSSAGGAEDAVNDGGANAGHTGDPAHDTGDFNDGAPGNLRVDYVLPSVNLNMTNAEVFWPTTAELAARGTPNLLGPGNGGASDHRLVLVDLNVAPTSGAAFTLNLLHASDLEGGVDAIDRAANFAAVVEALENSASAIADGTLILSAGDNYIPGPFFNAAADQATFRDGGVFNDVYNQLFGVTTYNALREGSGRVDISIMNVIGFDASALGNHEFDQGSETLRNIIKEDFRSPAGPAGDRWAGAQFPYLSANLDFSGDAFLSGLHSSSIRENTEFVSGPAESQAGATNIPKLAPATYVQVGGEFIGVVGATTQLLEIISSPGGTVGTAGTSNDMDALAAVLQPVIDDLLNGTNGAPSGINKVILVSHLQQLSLEQSLAGKLSGVDIIVAGGSDTLLAQPDDRLRPGDTPAGSYPALASGLDGNPTFIVSTDGEYSYVGSLTVGFDAAGVLLVDSVDAPLSGAFPTDAQGVADLWGSGDPFAAGTKGEQVQFLVDAVQGVVQAKDGNILGKTGVFLEGRRSAVRTEETNLGNLTADANLALAKSVDPSVVVSLKNGGGIRAEIGGLDGITGQPLPPQGNSSVGKGPGDISQLDVENSLRFNNGLTLIDVSLGDLVQLLEHGVASTDAAGVNTPGQFPQVGGLRFSFDPTLPVGSRVRSVALTDDLGSVSLVVMDEGTFVANPASEIRMVTLNFLAGGGDGYPFPALGQNRVDLVGSGLPDGPSTFAPAGSEQDALAEYLLARFATVPYYTSEAGIEQDRRIENLAQNGGRDRVTDDVASGELQFTDLGSLDLAGAEISAFDFASGRLFVTFGGGLQVVDLVDPANPMLVGLLAPVADGSSSNAVTSVAVGRGATAGLVAVAVPDATVTNDGKVFFYDAASLAFVGSVDVGPLPDMLTFTPDGLRVLVANEGQSAGSDNEPHVLPNPAGSVSIITINTINPSSSAVTTLSFSSLDGQATALRDKGVRLNASAPSVGADLEPEYIAIEGNTAYVTLQENNAVAVIADVTAPTPFTVDDILPLGLKDHTLPLNQLDPSNQDGGIHLRNVPLWGMFMPDSIGTFQNGGATYFVTANEGDGRDVDETRVGSLTLDPGVFPAAAALQANAVLGRINASNVDGDTDGDGDIDQIHVFGGRSFSIFDAAGNLVFDSGDQIARITAAMTPTLFNANNGNPADFDSRSDDKGAEPEGLTIATIGGNTYALVGLERAGGGVMAYNITNPVDVQFVGYFRVDGDVSPEGLLFIPASDSPNGRDLLVVTHEVSNNIRVFQLDAPTASPVYLVGDDLMARADAGNNRLVFSVNNAGEIVVRIDGAVYGPFPVAGKIIAFGGDGNDVMSVASSVNVPVEFHGEGGDDYLAGGRGDDLLVGGPGNDRLLGGDGNNTLYGDNITGERSTDGDDRLHGRDGMDGMFGGGGDDTLNGGGGDDLLDGGSGHDLLAGGLGDDLLRGGSGSDILSGSSGNDILLGEAGDDQLSGDGDRDLLIGGLDTDRLRGGTGDDLLIGGTTSHDANDAALLALMTEWKSANPFATRIANLMSGATTGGAALNTMTGADDGLANRLAGDLGMDWLFQGVNELLTSAPGDRIDVLP